MHKSNFISKTLANGVRFDIKDEGGLECNDFMTFEFKFAVNILMVNLFYIIYKNY